jgi:hypothetical protein
MQEPLSFDIIISDNRNYAYITASNYPHQFDRPLDDVEYLALDNWFDDNQAEQHNVRLRIADDSKSYTLQLSKGGAVVYWHPDTLKERVDSLLKVESEVFNYIKYLLDSTKF